MILHGETYTEDEQDDKSNNNGAARDLHGQRLEKVSMMRMETTSAYKDRETCSVDSSR
jgi:hypothetical protein